ncbi:MAG: CDP-glycerol glycerophosphotransferase family protein [Clostridioides sp.]|jgi:CDP-glycerol glycerophosphotransferase (TagB/SpsB family)|nr:CDP-glycerol glycerophosphotransferase family protein [Clostridioides sp.]
MDKIKSLLNMMFATIIYPFTKYKFKEKNIWLIGGHSGEIYNDNAKELYEYILSNHKEIEIYWVAKLDNPFFNVIPGKKIVKGSLKNYLYYYNAKVIIFSHSPSADIAPYNFAVPVLNYFHKRVTKVFLNHGTISFKKRKPMNPKLEKIIDKLLKSYNIVTAGSEFEKHIMTDIWGMSDESVYITGIARYDNLVSSIKSDEIKNNEKESNNSNSDEVKNNEKKSNNFNSDEIKERVILYTPTWRDWIKFSDGDFANTDYFKNTMELLNDEKLNNLLEEKNVYIKIFMHHLMHEFLDDIKKNITGKRIIFLDKDTDLGEEIKKADLNITDYSSTAIDFLLMNKPILFYQFDIEEYSEKVGSYIDLNKEMFGYLSYNSREAIQNLIKIIELDFKISDNQMKEKAKYIKFQDGKNCERIFNIIYKIV